MLQQNSDANSFNSLNQNQVQASIDQSSKVVSKQSSALKFKSTIEKLEKDDSALSTPFRKVRAKKDTKKNTTPEEIPVSSEREKFQRL